MVSRTRTGRRKLWIRVGVKETQEAQHSSSVAQYQLPTTVSCKCLWNIFPVVFELWYRFLDSRDGERQRCTYTNCIFRIPADYRRRATVTRKKDTSTYAFDGIRLAPAPLSPRGTGAQRRIMWKKIKIAQFFTSPHGSKLHNFPLHCRLKIAQFFTSHRERL